MLIFLRENRYFLHGNGIQSCVNVYDWHEYSHVKNPNETHKNCQVQMLTQTATTPTWDCPPTEASTRLATHPLVPLQFLLYKILGFRITAGTLPPESRVHQTPVCVIHSTQPGQSKSWEDHSSTFHTTSYITYPPFMHRYVRVSSNITNTPCKISVT